MRCEELFKERSLWQKNAFDRIKASLLTARDNAFLQYDGMQESYLVVVYGPSQIGKTSLILKLMEKMGIDKNLIVNGHTIQVFSESDAAMIPWSSCGAEYIIESTVCLHCHSLRPFRYRPVCACGGGGAGQGL